MVTHDLYGIDAVSLDAARMTIESLLGISFVSRESSYLGAYFQFNLFHSERLLLRCNVDPIDGEPAEQEFPDVKLLLYVDAAEHLAGWRGLLASRSDVFKLLLTRM